MIPYRELFRFTEELLPKVDQIILKYYQKRDSSNLSKENNSPVTICDIECEELIRKEINRQFPGHNIIGEEMDNQFTHISDFSWIIDPIDGTSSFISGKPLFATLICLIFKGEAIFGIIHQTITKESWIGYYDEQSNQYSSILYNNYKLIKQLESSKTHKVADSIICSVSPYLYQENEHDMLLSLIKHSKYQQYKGIFFGGDAYNYAMLAMGMIDIVIDADMKIYDFAAMIPIMKGSEAVITDWTGASFDLNLILNTAQTRSQTFNVLCTANNNLHTDALNKLHNKHG